MNRVYNWIVSLLIVVLLLVAGGRIYLSGLKVNTDLFSLIPNLPRIESQSKVRFLVEGDAELRARVALKQSLSGVVEFADGDLEALKKLCTTLYPYRAALLAGTEQPLFECRPVESCLKEHLLRQISNPEFSGTLFTCDPLLLAPTAFRGLLSSELSGKILFGDLRAGADPNQIDEALNKLRVEFPKTEIVWSGFAKFAASSRQRFEKEFTLLGTLSTVGILLVIGWAFRSVRLLGVSFISSVAGYLVGFASCIAFRGEVHSITLMLGGSLLGACVDYSVHWFAERYWRPELSAGAIWREVNPVLILGMGTSIVAIFPFVFTESLLLKEFFLFCLGALTGSWAIIALWPLPKAVNVRRSPYTLSHRLCMRLYGVFEHKAVIGLLGAVILAGFYSFKFDDDLRQMQAPLPELIRDELRLSKGGVPTAHLEIGGASEEEQIRNLQQVLSTFTSANDSPRLPVSIKLPDEASQSRSIENYQRYETTFASQISSVMSELGITPPVSNSGAELRRIDLKFVKALIPEIFSPSGAIVIPVINWKAGTRLPENVRLIDYRAEISSLFAKDRRQSLICLGVGYLIIGVILLFRYRALQALKLLIPCALSACLTLSMMILLGYPINFFTTMALALVLGLSVDYAVFFAECEQIEAVSLSVLASTATTAVAFAPLILSDTTLLSSVGVCMVIGVTSAMVFSPIARSVVKIDGRVGPPG